MQNHPEFREQLWTIVRALQNGLKEAGFNIGKTESPVTPVFFEGSVAQGTNVLKTLREEYDIFTSIVVYPVVPKGTIMLRIIPTAAHTLEHVEKTIHAFKEVSKRLKAGEFDAEEVTLENIK